MIRADLEFTRRPHRVSLSRRLGLPEGQALKLNEMGQPDTSGPRGLLLAIIGQAYLDALAGDEDALDYFESEQYRHHLDLLDLDPGWLPEGLKRC